MIKGISIPSSNNSADEVILPITGLTRPAAIDFDAKEQYIYFVNEDNGYVIIQLQLLKAEYLNNSQPEVMLKY